MLRNLTNLYIIYEEKMLMLYRIGSRAMSEPLWVGIGGHMEKDEINNPQVGVLRELKEETGIEEADIVDLKMKYITIRNLGDEIRNNYYFFAKLKNIEKIDAQSNEGKLEWVDINEVLNKKMPDSARCCLTHYLQQGYKDNDIYGVMAYINNSKISYDLKKLS